MNEIIFWTGTFAVLLVAVYQLQKRAVSLDEEYRLLWALLLGVAFGAAAVFFVQGRLR